MLTINQLARMTLQYRTLDNAVGAMKDYAAAIKHLEASGMSNKDAQAHPVAIVLADRIALLTRVDLFSDTEVFKALEQVKQLAEG